MHVRLMTTLFAASLFAPGAIAQSTPPPLVAAAPESVAEPAPTLAAEWYVAIGGAPEGPLTAPELRARNLPPDTLVWRDGMADWATLASVPELAAATLPPTPPALTPPALTPPPLTASAPTTPAAVSPVDTTAYFVAEASGPSDALSRETVTRRLVEGTIDPATLVWFEGLAEWTPLAETRLAELLEASVEPDTLPPVAFDAEAHLLGRWQARVQEAVDGLPETITVDYLFTFGNDGRFDGSGHSLLDLRAQGIAEPISLEVTMDGKWSVEALDERRLRLRMAGSVRTAAPALDMVETETFEEVSTLEIVDQNSLRDDDGHTIQRVGG